MVTENELPAGTCAGMDKISRASAVCAFTLPGLSANQAQTTQPPPHPQTPNFIVSCLPLFQESINPKAPQIGNGAAARQSLQPPKRNSLCLDQRRSAFEVWRITGQMQGSRARNEGDIQSIAWISRSWMLFVQIMIERDQGCIGQDVVTLRDPAMGVAPCTPAIGRAKLRHGTVLFIRSVHFRRAANRWCA